MKLININHKAVICLIWYAFNWDEYHKYIKLILERISLEETFQDPFKFSAPAARPIIYFQNR